MTKPYTHIFKLVSIYAILFIMCNGTVKGQFVNVDLDIEPELKTVVINPIEFPEVVINSGLITIGLGEPTMGVFGITAFSTQTVNIRVSYPEYLTKDSGEEKDRIPIEINSYYNNRGNNDYRRALPLQNNTAVISVLDADVYDERSSNYWETLFIYLTGSINVGNISEGNYYGDIELVVEYQ